MAALRLLARGVAIAGETCLALNAETLTGSAVLALKEY
jgi:hypothetical protein